MSSVDVETAKKELGKVFSKGCSGLVCKLLGKAWKSASSFTQGDSIGSDGDYSDVSPGDIVGYPGHVAVYVGEEDCEFIDVAGPGGACREVASGYGSQEVYKYSY